MKNKINKGDLVRINLNNLVYKDQSGEFGIVVKIEKAFLPAGKSRDYWFYVYVNNEILIFKLEEFKKIGMKRE